MGPGLGGGGGGGEGGRKGGGGATIPRIHCLLNPPLQPVPCEQVLCHETTGVWLKHITHTVNHKKTRNL